ncbi:MAG: hydantoinase B/oxoprolinase family protein, partial [Planctomycetota bacterium]
MKLLSDGSVAARIVGFEADRVVLLEIPKSQTHPDFWVGARIRFSSTDYLGTDDLGTEVTVHKWQHLRERESETAKTPNAQIGPPRTSVSPGGVIVRAALSNPLDQASIGSRVQLIAELEAPVLATRLISNTPLRSELPSCTVRLGTTRGTNALLTRQGGQFVLVTTRGFADIPEIGFQDRPDLFDLNIQKPTPLTPHVVEVDGRFDATGREIETLNNDAVRTTLQACRREHPSIKSLAISTIHASVNADHERRIAMIANEVGYTSVIRSSDVAARPGLVARMATTCLDAYLQPVLQDYVQRVQAQFGGPTRCHLRWMTSSGNLVESASFRGRDSVLSGPAGGVVALASIGREERTDVVGLDMGGTSTDVSRFSGQLQRRQESNVGGVPIYSSMMDIHTIASGGGSICRVQEGRLTVGPESAGADPGPACYGRGGPLCITDVNLLLGRIVPDDFPFPLNLEAAETAIAAQREQILQFSQLSIKELAEGFLQIAVMQMAEAVRKITTASGLDARRMTLVGFGGAAGMHVCRVADALGMSQIIDHPDAGLLSAVGIDHAPVGRIRTVAALHPVREAVPILSRMIDQHSTELRNDLRTEEHLANNAMISTNVWAAVRYCGTESALEISAEPLESLVERFETHHELTFGYRRDGMPVETTAITIEVTSQTDRNLQPQRIDTAAPHQSTSSKTNLIGPCIVPRDHSVLVIESGWIGQRDVDGQIRLVKSKGTAEAHESEVLSHRGDDAIDMELVVRRFQGIAESMGEVIRRTSVSVNVKERRDYSCAVFLGDGSLIANAPHVPVHLGAMGHTVRRLIEVYPEMSPDDVYVSNDPFTGGSHLPDVTLVTPVFCDTDNATRSAGMPCDFFVASRCHHAEIGGMVPGSMPPSATRLSEEGVVIRDFALVRAGVSYHQELADQLASGPFASRNVTENMADIAAAQAAGREGGAQIAGLGREWSLPRLNELTQRLFAIAGQATASWIGSLDWTSRTFTDSLDDGSKVKVTITVDSEKQRLGIDFSGTAPVHAGGFNATRSIVTSAVLYVLRCVCPTDLPLCDGVLDRIDLAIPPGLLDPSTEATRATLDPSQCPAVVAGNVETSNRVVDVLLGCLRSAAASQGTMNNLLLGDDSFGYYETICGGAGATPDGSGADAVHTHMTNTRITDPEILETR